MTAALRAAFVSAARPGRFVVRHEPAGSRSTKADYARRRARNQGVHEGSIPSTSTTAGAPQVPRLLHGAVGELASRQTANLCLRALPVRVRSAPLLAIRLYAGANGAV
jgi:hypothetical protein